MHGPILDKVNRDPRIEKRQIHEYDGANTLMDKNKFNRYTCLIMAKEAAVNAIDSWEGTASDITHVIMCTSTEYTAPTIDVRLIQELGLRPNVRRIPIVMAGCAGGGLGLQMAHDIVMADPSANVLLVATECVSSSLHRPSTFSIDTAIATTIFSDGAGAMIISGKGKYRISNPTSMTVPDTLDEMQIEPQDGGVHIVLSPKIHLLTSEAIEPFIKSMTNEKVDGYLVHPGGKSILGAIEAKLGADLTYSWQTLRDYGNTSSASIFYVIHGAWDKLTKGKYPVITFGQGLHVAGCLLHVE